MTPLLEWFDRLRPRREPPVVRPVFDVPVPVMFDQCVGCRDPKSVDAHPFCRVCRAMGELS